LLEEAAMYRYAIAFALGLLCGTTAVAQVPDVPPEFYNSVRPDFGQTLPLCVLSTSPTAELDLQTATAIADALLLEPAVVELEVDMAMLDEDGLWPIVFTALAESCIGVMGIQLTSGHQLPDWVTVSQPYLVAPYVLASTSGAENIGQLPAGSSVGVPLFTPVDLALSALVRSGGAPNGIRRLPYDRPELAAQLLKSGEFDAAVIWEPHLQSPAFAGIAGIKIGTSLAPLADAQRSVSILMRADDVYMREMIDTAITALAGT
jgi:hypothetical protein